MAITNYTDYINSLYDTQKNAAQSAYDTTAADINTQISGANDKYQPTRNQAYVNSLMAQRTYNENMANMGYSAGGQKSQTLQQSAINNLLTNQNTINTAYQDYVNELESQLRTAQTSLNTNLADIEANRSSALIEQSGTALNQAYQLYTAGIISASQFEQMTGIKPQNINRGSGGGSSKSITDYINQLLNASTINKYGANKTTAGMPDYIASMG